jgi:hypothetical protein
MPADLSILPASLSILLPADLSTLSLLPADLSMLFPNPLVTRLAHLKTLFLPANLSNSELLTPQFSEFQLSARYAGKNTEG